MTVTTRGSHPVPWGQEAGSSGVKSWLTGVRPVWICSGRLKGSVWSTGNGADQNHVAMVLKIYSFLSLISQDINSLITKKEKKIEHHDSKLTMCCFVTGPNTFDSPSAVAAAMTGSLAGLMDVLSPDDKKKGGYHEMLSTCWYNWNTHNQ